jgi:cytochrome c556
MYEEKIETEEKPFDVVEVKEQIEKLLTTYRAKKDELEWADDDWAADEINEELDQYAKEIKILKVKVREFEQEQA